ncbi:MAG TPA: RHS repeat-associated core domain-containing protein [Acidobacteriaceae bacterium]|nr:RHS repeat-associated core domain-containing protein [Acidobacteriaceae bacterium]
MKLKTFPEFDIALYSTDGTVLPIYARQPSVGLSYFSGGGETGAQAFVERSNQPGDSEFPQGTTTYYQNDQIGSARMQTAGGGWPVSQDVYYPYGVEPTPPADANHYKFATLERDAETGLDHAWFRQYASQMGRWLSPDPSNASYDLANPQSFNRYAYVGNRPLSFIDPLGLRPANCYIAQSECWGRGEPSGTSGGGDGEFTTYNWVSGDNGAYGYSSDTWSNMMQDGYGGGITDGYGGALLSADGQIVGYTWMTLSPLMSGPSSLIPSGTVAIGGGYSTAPNNGLPTPSKFKATIPGTNYCGPGGSGTPTDQTDAACAAHDLCYQNAGATFRNNIPFWPTSAQQRAAMQACDGNLCSTLNSNYSPTSAEAGQATLVETYFGCSGGYSLR